MRRRFSFWRRRRCALRCPRCPLPWNEGRKRDAHCFSPTGSKHEKLDDISGTARADHLNQLRCARNRPSIGGDDEISRSDASLFRRPIRHDTLHDCTLDSPLSLLGARLAQHHSEHSPRRRSGRLRSCNCTNRNSTHSKDEANKNSHFHRSSFGGDPNISGGSLTFRFVCPKEEICLRGLTLIAELPMYSKETVAAFCLPAGYVKLAAWSSIRQRWLAAYSG